MMSRNSLWRGIALLTLASISFAVQGCYTRVRVPVTVHQVEVERPPHETDLEVSLSIEPVKFRIGDPVAFRICVHNPHRHRVEVQFPSGCNVSYQVWDAKGHIVGPYRACNWFGSSISLDPDETFVYERTWPQNGRYFTSSGDLAPGRYWVRGGFVWGLEFVGETDAVMIEVMPRRSPFHRLD
jgi:hypothetical protein